MLNAVRNINIVVNHIFVSQWSWTPASNSSLLGSSRDRTSLKTTARSRNPFKTTARSRNPRHLWQFKFRRTRKSCSMFPLFSKSIPSPCQGAEWSVEGQESEESKSRRPHHWTPHTLVREEKHWMIWRRHISLCSDNTHYSCSLWEGVGWIWQDSCTPVTLVLKHSYIDWG